MEEFMLPAITETEMESALSETQYLLKRWRFAASSAGFLWIQPIGPKLAPEELAGFIALLKRGCRDNFPSAMLFDFNEVEVVGAQWTMVESLLLELAQSIGALCRVSSTHKRAASAVLLYRKDGERMPMSPGPINAN
jgi:hypothetical protein